MIHCLSTYDFFFLQRHPMTYYPLCRTLDMDFYFFTSVCAWFACMLTYVGTHMCACGSLRLMWSFFLDWPPPSSSNEGFAVEPRDHTFSYFS